MAERLTTEQQFEAWSLAEKTTYKGWKTNHSKSLDKYLAIHSATCTKCGSCIEKADINFYRTVDKKRKKLYYGAKRCCKPCVNLYTRKNRYGDSDKVDELLEHTHCEICETEFKNNRNKFIDHCHEHGHIRGVLCTKCNTMLGMIEKDKVIYKNLIKYIKR
jgi:hypothetical protein